MRFINKGAIDIEVSVGKYYKYILEMSFATKNQSYDLWDRTVPGIVNLTSGQLKWPLHWPPLEEGDHSETDISPGGFYKRTWLWSRLCNSFLVNCP